MPPDALRTHGTRLRSWVPDMPAAVALLRSVRNLTTHRVGPANQLHARRRNALPSNISLSAKRDSPIGPIFLTLRTAKGRVERLAVRPMAA